MTGGHVLQLAAVLAAIVAINLVVTWLLVRRDWDPTELLGTARYAPEDAARGSDVDEASEESDDGSGVPGDAATETTTLRTSAGTELTLSGPGTGREPPPLDADGETVVCRHCGAENRPGYRYCRWCVRSGFVDGDDDGAAGPAMTDRSL